MEIKCDVTGTPPPPIIWQRNKADLSLLNEEEVRVFSDGSLYLTRIQLIHAGNYTCHAQRNKDVMQTHVLTVHSRSNMFSRKLNKAIVNNMLRLVAILKLTLSGSFFVKITFEGITCV